MMKLMQWVSGSGLLKSKWWLELYPPFFLMRISVLEMKNSWRRVVIKLPLNILSRNPGGIMFGGYQASVQDPIAALACARVFPGYSCWTRASSMNFIRGGSTDLTLKFDFPPELEAQIRKELEEKGRSTPTFSYGFYLDDGTLATEITNTVAIRPKGYAKATSPPADDEFQTVTGDDDNDETTAKAK
jgi:acyl-coenzyme A thioesterase PaaI-like protein